MRNLIINVRNKNFIIIKYNDNISIYKSSSNNSWYPCNSCDAKSLCNNIAQVAHHNLCYVINHLIDPNLNIVRDDSCRRTGSFVMWDIINSPGGYLTTMNSMYSIRYMINHYDNKSKR